MNHIYKSIFNKALGVFTAVPEFASAHGKGSERTVVGRVAKGAAGFAASALAISIGLALTSTNAVAGPGIYINDAKDPGCLAVHDGQGLYVGVHGIQGGAPQAALSILGDPARIMPPKSYYALDDMNPCKSSVNATKPEEHFTTQTNRTLFYGDNMTASVNNNGAKNLTLGGRLDVNSGIIGVGDRGVNGTGATNSIRMGTGTTLDNANKNLNSIAIGVNTQATSDYATAIGEEALANGSDGALAIGRKATANATSGPMAIGYDAVTTGKSGIAQGYHAHTNAQSGLAIGDNAKASGIGQVAIGYASNAQKPDIDKVNTAAPNKADYSVTVGHYAGADYTGTNNIRTTLVGDSAGRYGEEGTQNTAVGSLAGMYVKGSNNVALGIGAGSGSATDKLEVSNTTAIGNAAKALTHNSISIGLNSKSGKADAFSGENSIAIGSIAEAMGTSSIAMGSHASTSNGHDSIALGTYATTENQKATAIGSYSAATGRQSLTIANNYDSKNLKPVSVASGDRATVIGAETTVSGNNSVAIGDTNTVASNRTYALGNNINVKAGADDSLAFGTKAGVGGANAIALGNTAKATQDNSIAQGTESATYGKNSVSIGYKAVSGLTAPTASQTNAFSVSIGNETEALDASTIAIGDKAKAKGGVDALAVGTQANAMTYKALAIGAYSQATGRQSTVIGNDIQGQPSIASGTRSQIIGVQSNVSGDNSVSIGDTNTIASARTYAIGNNINVAAGADDSLVFGTQANVGAVHSIAMGTTAAATGIGSIALGKSASATEQRAIAMGENALAGNEASMALGYNSSAKGSKQVSIGLGAGALKNATDSGAELATFVGHYAGADNASPTGNAQGVAVGVNAGRYGVSGIRNVAVGPNTGQKVEGDDNTAIGYNSGRGVKGTNNFAGGANAGVFVEGNNNVALGFNAGIGAEAKPLKVNRTTAVGSDSRALADDSVALGDHAIANNANSVAIGTRSTTSDIHTGDYTLNNSYTAAGLPNAANGTVSVGSAGKERQIQNVAAGVISATSTDAINGSQLYATNNYLSNLAGSVKNVLGGDAAVDNAGNVTMSNIGGTGKGNVNDAIAAANTKVAAGDNITVTPTTNTDGSKTYTVATKKDLVVDSVKAGDTTVNTDGVTIASGPSITKSGINANGRKVTGLVDGDINATSTDAVNGSQLHATNTKLADVENTANTAVQEIESANPTALTATKAGDTVTLTPNVIAGDLVNPATGAVNTPAAGDAGKLVTAGTVANALANTHFVVDTAKTDGELDAASKHDQKIKSGNKVTLQAGKNLKAKQTNAADGATVEFSLKDSISLTQVTAGTGDNQVVLNNNGVNVAGNTYINKDGLNANDKKITNVAPGAVTAASKDAVNGSQLYNVANNVKDLIGPDAKIDPATGKVTVADPAKGIGETGKGNIGDAIKHVNDAAKAAAETAAKHTTVVEGKNVKVTKGKNAAGGDEYTVATKDDLDVTSVTAGNTTVNTNGLTITGGPSVTRGGIDAGNRVISGVKAGDVSATSQEAVNGSQLHATNTKLDGVKAKADTAVQDVKSGDENALTAVKDPNTNIVTVTPKLSGNLVDANGNITAPTTPEEKGKLVTAGTVADALANTHFVVDTKATDGELDTASQADQKIKAGNKVTLQAGKNLKAKQTNGANGAQVEFSLKDSISLKEVTAGEGANQVVLNDKGVNVGGNTYINNDGLNANGNKITNVADGVDPKDAVNKGQLDAVKGVADSAVKSVKAKDGEENLVVDNTDPKNPKLSLKKDLTVDSVKAGDSTLNTDGLTIAGGPSVKKDGINAGDKTITNVAPGAVTPTSKDAVNGSQLYNVANNMKDLIGPDATIDPATGKVTVADPAKGIGETGKGTIGEAIKSVKDKADTAVQDIKSGDEKALSVTKAGNTYTITPNLSGDLVDADGNITAPATDADKGKLVTAGTVAQALANTHFVVDTKATDGELDTASEADQKIKAGNKVTLQAGKNLKAKQTNGANGAQVEFSLKDSISLTQVTAGDSTLNTDGLTITGGPSVKKDGIDAGNKKITGVADGNVAAGSTDAVNGGQLAEVKSKADSAVQNVVSTNPTALTATKVGDTVRLTPNFIAGDLVNADGSVNTPAAGDEGKLVSAKAVADALKANHFVVDTKGNTETGSEADAKVGSSNKVTFEAGKNLVAKQANTANGGATVKFSLQDDISLNSVTAGTGDNQVVLGNDGVKVGGNTYINNNGLNANDKKITNVAPGAVTPTSKDAVNGSQLYNVANNVKNLIGPDATIDPATGKVTVADPAKGIAGTGKTTIGEAIQSAAAAANTKVKAGTNIEVGEVTNKDGSKTYTVSTAKDLTVDSVKAGDTTVDKDGLTIAGGPSVTKAGINAGGNTITNVADGVNPNDAVNKGQLDKVAGLAGSAVQDIKSGDEKALSVTKAGNTYTITPNLIGELVDADGNITPLTPEGKGKLVTAGTVAQALENTHFLVNTVATAGGELDAASQADQKIKAGNKVTFQAGKNLKAKQTNGANGTEVEFSLQDNVTVKTVNTDNVKANNGIEIVDGPSMTKDGINAAGKAISNVANGNVAKGSKDAVNGGQLHETAQSVADVIGGGATVKDGKVVAGQNGIGNTGQNTVHGAIAAINQNTANNFNQIRGDLRKMDRDLRGGIAGALATAGLPQAFRPGKSMVAAAASTYRGQSGLAIGVSRISDNGKVILKVTGNTNSRGDFGGTIGAGYQW